MKRRRVLLGFVMTAIAGVLLWFLYSATVIPNLEKNGVEFRRSDSGLVWSASLDDPKLGGREVGMLRHAKTLESVSLSNSSATLAGIRELKRLPKLQELKLSESDIGPESASELAGIKSLRHLVLNHCPNITPESLLKFQGHPSLQSIVLLNGPISHDELIGLEQSLPGVSVSVEAKAVAGIPEKLPFEAQWKTPGGSRDLVLKIPHGTKIDGTIAVTGEDLASLPADALVELQFVPEIHLDEEAIVALSRFPRLQKLWVKGEFTDAGLEAIGQLKDLEFLSIGVPRDSDGTAIPAELTAAGIAHLNGLAKLETLFLYFPGIDPTAISSLRGLPQLRWINILSGGLRDQDLEFLKTFPRLDHLGQNNNKLTDASREFFLSMEQLTSLDVSSNQISPAVENELITLMKTRRGR